MIVQCPQCQTGHVLEEGDFGRHAQAEVECIKCQTRFVVKAPTKGSGSQPKKTGKWEEVGKKTITVVGAQIKLPKGKNVALVVLKGVRAGEAFRFDKPGVIIGREGTDIVLNDPEVSATHCSVEVRGNYAILTDLGSTNGTYVDDQPIKSCHLEHLAEFRIGRTTFLFTITNME